MYLYWQTLVFLIPWVAIPSGYSRGRCWQTGGTREQTTLLLQVVAGYQWAGQTYCCDFSLFFSSVATDANMPEENKGNYTKAAREIPRGTHRSYFFSMSCFKSYNISGTYHMHIRRTPSCFWLFSISINYFTCRTFFGFFSLTFSSYQVAFLPGRESGRHNPRKPAKSVDLLSARTPARPDIFILIYFLFFIFIITFTFQLN